VQRDPQQLHNLADDPAAADMLAALRQALDRWTEETGDTVPKNLTPTVPLTGRKDRQPDFQRGEMPGAGRHATELTAKGPVRD
jgi:arylsulfatase